MLSNFQPLNDTPWSQRQQKHLSTHVLAGHVICNAQQPAYSQSSQKFFVKWYQLETTITSAVHTQFDLDLRATDQLTKQSSRSAIL